MAPSFAIMLSSRCVYLTYLKNPFRFQDEFWCRFISIWSLMIAIIVNGSHFFLRSPKPPLAYYMCTGQRSSNALIYDSPLIDIVSIFYLLTIVGVTIRMKWHKRNSNSNLTATYSTAEGVDGRKMGNSILVMWILASFITSSTIFKTIDKLEPLQLNQPPYTYLCYFRSLVAAPQIAFGLFVFLVFNRDYILSIMDEVSYLKK